MRSFTPPLFSGILVLGVLSLLLGMGPVAVGGELSSQPVLHSDWVLEDPLKEETPPSVLDLATLEQKQAELERLKAEEEAKLEQEISLLKERRIALIECMNQKGVQLFSTSDPACGACKRQREYFGEDFDKFKGYVDCHEKSVICPMRNIKSYPTWYLGSQLGIKREGLRDLPTLARLTGCEWY